MKLFGYYLLVLFALIAFSCGSGRQNFNKQKYTSLKSKEVKIEVNALAENDAEAETLVYSEKKTEEQKIYQETITNSNGVYPRNNDLIPEGETDQSDSDFDTSTLPETPILKKKPQESIQKKNLQNSPLPGIDQAVLPFFIAWLLYVALAIAAVVLVFIGIFFGAELLMFAGLGIWLFLIVYGILLLIFSYRQKKKENSPLIKLIAAATMIEAIIVTALSAFVGFLIILFSF